MLTSFVNTYAFYRRLPIHGLLSGSADEQKVLCILIENVVLISLDILEEITFGRGNGVVAVYKYQLVASLRAR